MDYTYKILQYRPQDHFLQIQYSTEGKQTIIRNFRAPRVTSNATVAAEIAAFAEANVPYGLWQVEEEQTDIDPDLVDTTTEVAVTYTPPAPPTPTLADQKAEASYQVIAASAQKQAEGVTWTAPNSNVYRFPCGQIEIDRMRLYKSEALAGQRTDGRWRMYQVTAEGEEVLYMVLNLSQLQTVAGLMIAHVNQCEEAEQNAITKIRGGDLAADFQTEFDALNV